MERIKNYIQEHKTFLPMIIASILALLMFLTIFMPYATATEEQAELLEEFSESFTIEELDLEGEDLINISMYEYARVYNYMGKGLYVALVIIIAILSVCTILFSALKKPVLTILFDILSFFVFCIQNWDYKDRGIIPSDNYDWGVAYYIFFIASIIVFASAIWLFVVKRKEKNQGA